MKSGLLPAKWIGIMPSLHRKAYHSAFLAPEVGDHFIGGACASCLLMPVRSVKQNDIIFRKKLCIYSLLTMTERSANEKTPSPGAERF
jgi:hypothetical protein